VLIRAHHRDIDADDTIANTREVERKPSGECKAIKRAAVRHGASSYAILVLIKKRSVFWPESGATRNLIPS